MFSTRAIVKLVVDQTDTPSASSERERRAP
jgi:hypothetical protein